MRRALGWAALGGALVCLAAPASAQAPGGGGEGGGESTAAREAAMFGAPDEAPAAGAPSPAADREAAMFGDETPSDREASMFGGEAPASTGDAVIEATLADADDPLTVGARFILRFQYANYLGAYDDLEEDAAATAPAELSSPMLLDIYLDGRPAERVRAFVGMRLEQELTTSGQFFEIPLARLDEAWLKFDLGRSVFFTVGKQRIKWGAARFWNPTDFINRTRLDPLSVVDLRFGVPLIKVHVPLEAAGGNLYAVAQLDGATAPEQVGGAARMEWVLGPSEVSATVAARKGAPLRLGADISAGVGPLELRAEAAVSRGGDAVRWTGTYDPEQGELPTLEERSEDWIPQAVGSVEWGIPYGDDDTMYLSAEYFYNDAGYDDASLTPWLVGVGDFEALYVGKHYAGLNLAIIAPGDWDDHSFLLSGLSNLSDGSTFLRFDHQVTVLTRLRISTYVGGAVGAVGGEFTLDSQTPTFNLGDDPRIAQPLSGTQLIAGPRILAGTWLSVDI